MKRQPRATTTKPTPLGPHGTAERRDADPTGMRARYELRAAGLPDPLLEPDDEDEVVDVAPVVQQERPDEPYRSVVVAWIPDFAAYEEEELLAAGLETVVGRAPRLTSRSLGRWPVVPASFPYRDPSIRESALTIEECRVFREQQRGFWKAPLGPRLAEHRIALWQDFSRYLTAKAVNVPPPAQRLGRLLLMLGVGAVRHVLNDDGDDRVRMYPDYPIAALRLWAGLAAGTGGGKGFVVAAVARYVFPTVLAKEAFSVALQEMERWIAAAFRTVRPVEIEAWRRMLRQIWTELLRPVGLSRDEVAMIRKLWPLPAALRLQPRAIVIRRCAARLWGWLKAQVVTTGSRMVDLPSELFRDPARRAAMGLRGISKNSGEHLLVQPLTDDRVKVLELTREAHTGFKRRWCRAYLFNRVDLEGDRLSWQDIDLLLARPFLYMPPERKIITGR